MKTHNKYGPLFKSINAARYAYTFMSAPYSEKPEEEGGKYYVQGTEAIVQYLVDRLSSKSRLAGRNISFDRLYTSIPLARWLLTKNITFTTESERNPTGAKRRSSSGLTINRNILGR